MTKEQAQQIIKDNIQVIYKIPNDAYPALSRYLNKGKPLRHTLLSLLNYLKTKDIIFDSGAPYFWMTAQRLTKVRGRKSGNDISNRHLNMLCAMGLFHKVTQKPNIGKILHINEDFLDKTGKRRPFGVFGIVRYNDKNLRDIEEQCTTLDNMGITAGNISRDNLAANGLEDIANYVYYANDRTELDRKQRKYDRLCEIIRTFIDEQGYCTKQQIYGEYRRQVGSYKTAEVVKTNKELDKIFKIFGRQLREKWRYKPPNEEEIEKFGLLSREWIWIKKSGDSMPLPFDFNVD